MKTAEVVCVQVLLSRPGHKGWCASLLVSWTLTCEAFCLQVTVYWDHSAVRKPPTAHAETAWESMRERPKQPTASAVGLAPAPQSCCARSVHLRPPQGFGVYTAWRRKSVRLKNNVIVNWRIKGFCYMVATSWLPTATWRRGNGPDEAMTGQITKSVTWNPSYLGGWDQEDRGSGK
jgi:hypothetical protein